MHTCNTILSDQDFFLHKTTYLFYQDFCAYEKKLSDQGICAYDKRLSVQGT